MFNKFELINLFLFDQRQESVFLSRFVECRKNCVNKESININDKWFQLKCWKCLVKVTSEKKYSLVGIKVIAFCLPKELIG